MHIGLQVIPRGGIKVLVSKSHKRSHKKRATDPCIGKRFGGKVWVKLNMFKKQT